MKLSRHLPVLFPFTVQSCPSGGGVWVVGCRYEARPSVPNSSETCGLAAPQCGKACLSDGEFRLVEAMPRTGRRSLNEFLGQHPVRQSLTALGGGKPQSSCASLTLASFSRIQRENVEGAWKSGVGVGQTRFPPKIGRFSANRVFVAISKPHLTVAKPHLTVAKTRLSVTKTRLTAAKTRLSVAKTRLSIPRSRIVTPRTRVGVAKTRLGSPRTRLTEPRKQLGSSRRPLTFAKTRFISSRTRFISPRTQVISARSLLINPRKRLFIPRLDIQSPLTPVIIRKRALVLSRARLEGVPTRSTFRPRQLHSVFRAASRLRRKP